MQPDAHKEMIFSHLQEIKHNQCETIRAFGLRIAETFTRVPARLIQPPLVEYRDCKTVKPKNGEWKMNYGCDELEVLTSATTNLTWTILNMDRSVHDIKLKQFAKGV